MLRFSGFLSIVSSFLYGPQGLLFAALTGTDVGADINSRNVMVTPCYYNLQLECLTLIDSMMTDSEQIMT